jgi:hypothetical protein
MKLFFSVDVRWTFKVPELLQLKRWKENLLADLLRLLLFYGMAVIKFSQNMASIIETL